MPLSLVPSFPQAILLISIMSDSFFLFLSLMEEELDIHALLYLTSLTQQSVILKSIHVVVFVGSSFRWPAEKWISYNWFIHAPSQWTFGLFPDVLIILSKVIINFWSCVCCVYVCVYLCFYFSEINIQGLNCQLIEQVYIKPFKKLKVFPSDGRSFLLIEDLVKILNTSSLPWCDWKGSLSSCTVSDSLVLHGHIHFQAWVLVLDSAS